MRKEAPITDQISSADDHALQQAIEAIKKIWLRGSALPTHLPGSPDQQAELSGLLSDMLLVQTFALSLSKGDLSQSMKSKGVMAGSLKALQADLRHLTWQTQMIANGDFSQKVDFMGEFSEAFNSMVARLAEARAALEKTNRMLEQLATIDGLTQIANRRYFDEYLRLEWARAYREKSPISLIMVDIDCFKGFNDTYGHQAGDDCLKTVARIISEIVTRPNDLVVRYGGEEFSVILPNTKAGGAIQVAEKIRAAVLGKKIPHGASTAGPYLTLSLGVFCLVPAEDKKPAVIISQADRALYEAKKKGRNRVVLNQI